ncbi:MAG: transporter related protein [Labilithrix sp.]|nr:transporter related protein [Labilithrix sp.]
MSDAGPVPAARKGPAPAPPRARDPRGAIVRLLAYLAPFRGSLVLAGGCIVAYSLLGLVGPYLVGLALDRFIAGHDASGLAVVAGLMIAAYLASSICQLAASFLMARVAQLALARVRGDLFRHLQTLPVAFYDRSGSGQIMSRLTSDIDAINQAVGQNVTTLVASILSIVGILGAMFLLNVRLALASVAVVIIMYWFTRLVAAYTRKGFKELQRDLGQLNGVMAEAIGGQRVNKAFSRNESALARFEEANERGYASGVYASTYSLMLMPLTVVLGNLFIIVLAGAGATLALRGLVTVGVIATFISYALSFFQPLRQLSTVYNTLQSAVAGAERVFETIDTASEENAGAAAPEAIRGDVRFDGVTFGYRPGSPVLRDVSLHARAGQMVALVGPTGAGKTTIINLLTRFYEIEHGVITVDGTDIRQVEKSALRRRLGLVLQDTFLFSTTVMENIRYGRLSATDEEVLHAAELAEADAFIRQLPDGYQTVLSERAATLSHGQRQLLAIARTLVADPPILILDEATSNVDTRTEARIQKALATLMKGRTSFVIAHRLSTIREADQVLVIDGGTVVERGTHAQLLAAHGVYRRLYERQFKGYAL